MTQPIAFQLLAQEGQARAGIVSTRRGDIETPVFMPVGTAGSVKGVRFEQLEQHDLDARIILGNTYHLWLRPGLEIIRAAGGLHRFIGWDRALLTDSGGFQVWSLGELRTISEAGTQFRSHVDGSLQFLSPEVSMEVQAVLGSDIVMVFDECTPGQAPHSEARQSMELTTRWARRSRDRFDVLQREGADPGRQPVEGLSGTQALFGIVQGAAHLDLRRESLERNLEIGFDGYAIGGLSVGEEKSVMWSVVGEVAPLLPAELPRYLMGVGTPVNILEGIERGIDMFDCVMPTRNGRNGMLFTKNGIMNMRNKKWADDFSPVDPDGTSFVDHQYSRAFLRHLVISGEMLGAQIASQHNLAFYLWLVKEARRQILNNTFAGWKEEMVRKISARL